jgi:fructokinase
MPDTVCLGEALIDFVPLESGVSLIEAPSFKKAAGGAPANVAAGLAKLGLHSAFVGKVGSDPFGRFLEKTFGDAGVDVSRMIFDKQVKTGLAFVAHKPGGVPEFTFYRDPSADMLLEPSELDADFIARSRVFHYGSISMISDPGKSATRGAAKIALDAGAIISYDPNYRPSLWESPAQAKAGMIEGLEFAHVVKVSEEELTFLTGLDSLASGAAELLKTAANASVVFVTRGPDGCFWATRNEQGSSPGFRVQPVDTTGAGDAFVAGTLFKLLEMDVTPRKMNELGASQLGPTCRFANAMGAIVATKLGAIQSMPTIAEVDNFLNNH